MDGEINVSTICPLCKYNQYICTLKTIYYDNPANMNNKFKYPYLSPETETVELLIENNIMSIESGNIGHMGVGEPVVDEEYENN